MSRYAMLSLLGKCAHCGSPVPVNGPFQSVTCGACFKKTAVSAAIIGNLCNDFEEEYEGLESGSGTAGTVMGDGTWEYKVRKLPPCCTACTTELPAPAPEQETAIACPKCGETWHARPAPDWLRKQVRSAVQTFARERETAGPAAVDEKSLQPIVMACPKCGGSLSITAANERIMHCTYCATEVYVPDAVWLRLHPVRQAEAWFLRFEGETGKALHAIARRRDEEDERQALKRWKCRRRMRGGKKRRLGLFGILLGTVSFSTLINLAQSMQGSGQDGVSTSQAIVLAAGIAGIIAAAVIGIFQLGFGYTRGPGARCKQALAELARKHHWKHEAAEYKFSLGTINTKFKGREVEIDPNDEYAIEVDIDSPFYLKTEPPGYPPEDLRRFSSGDARFDEFFPIRWAQPEIARRLQDDEAFRAAFLDTFFWFLDRWDGKIGLFKLDWCDLAVHLAPGHRESQGNVPRWLYPEEIEPLLEDTVGLAKALEALVAGKPVHLPREQAVPAEG